MRAQRVDVVVVGAGTTPTADSAAGLLERSAPRASDGRKRSCPAYIAYAAPGTVRATRRVIAEE